MSEQRKLEVGESVKYLDGVNVFEAKVIEQEDDDFYSVTYMLHGVHHRETVAARWELYLPEESGELIKEIRDRAYSALELAKLLR